MTHDPTNASAGNSPQNSNLPPLPQAGREQSEPVFPPLPPLPCPDRDANELELPALPPLPTVGTTKEAPKPAPEPPCALPIIPSSNDSDPEPGNMTHIPLPESNDRSSVDIPPAPKKIAPELTEEQKFVLSLTPNELQTLCEGSSFVPAAVAMADGEVDAQEREAFGLADEKFIELFFSGNPVIDEEFNTQFAESVNQVEAHNTFGEKISNASDDDEVSRWVTFFMADLSRVLGKAPEIVREKIVGHVRESCLEVAEASGSAHGANICGAEATAIYELLSMLGIELSEESLNRIISSVNLQPEETYTDVIADELTKDQIIERKRIIENSESLKAINDLEENELTELWLGLLTIPSLVAFADSEADHYELETVEEAHRELSDVLGLNDGDQPPSEAVAIDILDSLFVTPCVEAMISAQIMGPSLVLEGTALDRNTKIKELIGRLKLILNRLPVAVQSKLNQWLLESCVKVAEATGSEREGDDKIGIEERQFLVQLFDELLLDYKGTPLEQRLNLHPEGQTFEGYYQSLNQQDRVRLLALPQMLVEIVAAADGKIDAAEAKAIAPILKEETALIDEGFAALRQSEADEICAFGSALSKEYRALRGKNKKQLEWLFGLLDGYWKMIAVMPDPLQDNIKSSIARMVVKIAAVSGEESGVGGNIGMDEALTINLIFEALGIDSDELETELEESQ